MINSAVEWCWIDLFLMGMTGMRSEKEKREVGLGRLVEHGVRDSKVDRTELHLIPGTRLYRKTVFPLSDSCYSPVGSGVMVISTTCELEDVMLIMEIFMETIPKKKTNVKLAAWHDTHFSHKY